MTRGGGVRAHESARRYRRRLLGQHQRYAVEFTGLWAVTIAAVIVESSGVPRAFLTGALVSAGVWLVWWVLTAADTAHQVRRDALAEAWTAQDLEFLRRDGWRVFQVLAFQEFDIDHVVVGPGGVCAVKTKWTEAGLDLATDRVDRSLRTPVDQAWWSARRLRDYLHDEGHEVVVQAAVVVWGPNVPVVANGVVRARAVDVVVGAQIHEWRAELACGRGLVVANLDAIVASLEPLLEPGTALPPQPEVVARTAP